MFRRLLESIREALTGFATEPTVILCGSTAVLIASHYQGSTGYYRTFFDARLDDLPYSNTIGHFWWFASSLLLYMIVPLVLSVATKGSFNERYGLGLGDWRTGLKIMGLFLLVMLPSTYFASTLSSFKGMYPLAAGWAYTTKVGGVEAHSLKLFVVYELAYMAYFIGWEFLFRGWMLQGLVPHFGKVGAILIQTAPFAIMHLGKAELEAMGSIVAGIALGILALRTRSFWYGALLHGLIAVFMDVLAARPVLFPSP